MKKLALMVLLLSLTIVASVRVEHDSGRQPDARVPRPMLNSYGNLNPTEVSDVNSFESLGSNDQKYERVIAQNDVPFACSPCMGTIRSRFLMWLYGFQVARDQVVGEPRSQR
jgi:hypothetical protein